MSPLAGIRAARSPKYIQIYDNLAARVAGGEWAVGNALPPQRELSEQYGVTLMTLRQALQLLEDERVVVTEAGKGTFVAPFSYNYDLGHLRSFSRDMQTQGAELRTEVLGAGLIAASTATASRLGLNHPGEVFEIRRLRRINLEPVVLQSSHVSPELGRALSRVDLTSTSIYELLAVNLRVEIARATETIRPTVLSAHDATLLHLEPGSPALASHHLSFDSHGEPVIDDIALLPGNAVAITADRSPHGVALSYSFHES